MPDLNFSITTRLHPVEGFLHSGDGLSLTERRTVIEELYPVGYTRVGPFPIQSDRLGITRYFVAFAQKETRVVRNNLSFFCHQTPTWHVL